MLSLVALALVASWLPGMLIVYGLVRWGLSYSDFHVADQIVVAAMASLVWGVATAVVHFDFMGYASRMKANKSTPGT